ncbi:hypothetical protein GOP47_0002604 [Adiantum capillus-veneris]|uniref:Uncharacterized protein n=1 Tax=Adiantum capillus-veneris TaxID=13818 RepID=A0A9D4VAE4_ADICA|nr:hypothetical protein GOP47_0002604 [Adiantum capillus-veneris]
MTNLFTPPYMQPVQYAGGFMGSDTSFRISRESEGKVLKRIQVFRRARSISAISFWLTGDTTTYAYGDPSRSESSTFEFSEGERIIRLELQENFSLTRAIINVGRIRFQTSRWRDFEFGMSVPATGKVITVNVGSGVCVGLRGNVALAAINMLGFMFLRPIESVRLYSLEYPTISSSTITPIILEELPGTIKNDDEEPLHWVLAGSRQFVTSSTWKTQSANDEAGLVSYLRNDAIPINVILGIDTPKLVPTGPAGASTTFGWETVRTFPSSNQVQGSIADFTVSTDEYSVWCHISDTLAPAQSLITKRAALVGEANINNLQCSARIQVITENSSLPFATFTFPVQVLYSARAHSDVQILI